MKARAQSRRKPSTRKQSTQTGRATKPRPANRTETTTLPESATFAKSSNAFAMDLYGKVRELPGDLAVSPLSISVALAMTWAGARGETSAQMKKVLHAEAPAERVVDLAGKLIASYQGGETTVRIANRLFGDQSYTFSREYLDLTGKALGAPLETLDFMHAPEPARKHINDWIADKTERRIRDLLPQGSVNANTRLVLANAIYFLGDWQRPFKKGKTVPAPFHVSPNQKKNVLTMHQSASFAFAATGGVKVLEMPYQGGHLAMTLVLPDAIDGLDALEKRLDTAAFDAWIAALTPQVVSVSLPRFKIDPSESLRLNKLLEALGMPMAFDATRADFSGMTANATHDLYLSAVIHKAFVKLDEKGTEAAAATGGLMAVKSAMRPAAAVFNADHPFLYFLRDLKSGAILFMGRVHEPKVE